jgi:hypothetical protein
MGDMPLYLCPDCAQHYTRKRPDYDEFPSKETVTARILRGDEVGLNFSCLECVHSITEGVLRYDTNYYEQLRRVRKTNA